MLPGPGEVQRSARLKVPPTTIRVGVPPPSHDFALSPQRRTDQRPPAPEPASGVSVRALSSPRASGPPARRTSSALPHQGVVARASPQTKKKLTLESPRPAVAPYR